MCKKCNDCGIKCYKDTSDKNRCCSCSGCFDDCGESNKIFNRNKRF